MTSAGEVTAWRHACAIALLPFTNTVVIPSALLAQWPHPWGAPPAATAALLAAGLTLALGGLWLVVHSIRLFMRLGRGTLAPWDPTQALVGDGAYRHSRNPMKAGLFLILAGETLMTRSTALLVWFACFVLVNALYIRLHEEAGLRARFGEQYRNYCERVPRWWPKLAARKNQAAEEATP
ncbi:MAG TPA: isoprenylcysteine carboxylmethyltransferase family protein [Gammaproteobacteria bacterium]